MQYISHNGYIDIDLKNIFVQIDLKKCNDKYRHIDTDIWMKHANGFSKRGYSDTPKSSHFSGNRWESCVVGWCWLGDFVSRISMDFPSLAKLYMLSTARMDHSSCWNASGLIFEWVRFRAPTPSVNASQQISKARNKVAGQGTLPNILHQLVLIPQQQYQQCAYPSQISLGIGWNSLAKNVPMDSDTGLLENLQEAVSLYPQI